MCSPNELMGMGAAHEEHVTVGSKTEALSASAGRGTASDMFGIATSYAGELQSVTDRGEDGDGGSVTGNSGGLSKTTGAMVMH